MKAITVRRTPLDLSAPCKPWPGRVCPEGYGKVTVDGQERYVHRLTYQLLVGPIPRGWEVDHVCHTSAIARGECGSGPCEHRACYEPAHLEAVSSRENSIRGAHPLFAIARSNTCRKGHDLTDPANVITRKNGRRRCRPCARQQEKEWRARRARDHG